MKETISVGEREKGFPMPCALRYTQKPLWLTLFILRILRRSQTHALKWDNVSLLTLLFFYSLCSFLKYWLFFQKPVLKKDVRAILLNSRFIKYHAL